MSLSFTQYMNMSIGFRSKLIDYCVSKGNKAQETRNTLHLLDAMDCKAENDSFYRSDVFGWLNCKTGTLKLRDLSKDVGFDYWENIKTSNIIDTFDSFQGIN